MVRPWMPRLGGRQLRRCQRRRLRRWSIRAAILQPGAARTRLCTPRLRGVRATSAPRRPEHGSRVPVCRPGRGCTPSPGFAGPATRCRGNTLAGRAQMRRAARPCQRSIGGSSGSCCPRDSVHSCPDPRHDSQFVSPGPSRITPRPSQAGQRSGLGKGRVGLFAMCVPCIYIPPTTERTLGSAYDSGN